MTEQLLVMLAILLVAILIGTPVSFSLGFTGVVSILIFMSPNQLSQIAAVSFAQGTSMNQLVAPLFILMAEFLAKGNVATDIFSVLNKYLVRIKGGLALSTTLAATVFAALCGSSPATAASIGRISISQMTHRGYRGDFATGVVAAGGTLGIMIPPSITFVVYGIITETSIAKLLIAGILPGLLLSALFCLFIIIRVKLDPTLAGLNSDGTRAKATVAPEEAAAVSMAGVKEDFVKIVPPLALIVLVLGSLYTGLATPTESAGFGAIGALFLVFSLGRMSKELFLGTMSATARTSTMILFLVIFGMFLSYVVSYLGIAQEIAKLIVGTGLNKWVVITLLYVLWFILGCLMDPGSMVILTVPFVFPTIIALGFDPIWLGVVSTLTVEIGMITPPVGLNLFVLKTVTDVPMKQIIGGALPFVFVLIVALFILTVFPDISLYLPSRM